MAKAVNFGLVAALLLVALNSAYAEAERCVPAADGAWRCGKDVTEADAAPLPEPQSRSLPPVMLIDPARFGEGDMASDLPPETSAEEPGVAEASNAADAEIASAETARSTSVQSPAAREAPAEMSKPVIAAAPRTVPAAEPDRPISGNFSVQLAVASSPRGFDSLLAKLGSAARNSQRRQLANGSWVLLLGSFSSIAQARNAIPTSVEGAFARDISTLNFR